MQIQVRINPSQFEWPCEQDFTSEAHAPDYDDLFVQEVRRFYPFFPAVVARVRRDFEWKGYGFRHGTRTILDLFGTNHDERAWTSPDEFRPERFRAAAVTPFNLIPQGGGDAHAGHRCAGEAITVALMKAATRFLCTRIKYDVPSQDLTINQKQLPALGTDTYCSELNPPPPPRSPVTMLDDDEVRRNRSAAAPPTRAVAATGLGTDQKKLTDEAPALFLSMKPGFNFSP